MRAPLRKRLQPPALPAIFLPDGTPVSAFELVGDSKLLTDGSVANEGAEWDAFPAARIESSAGIVTFDLERPTELHTAWIQADANDTYAIFGSLDGNSFSKIGVLPRVEGQLGLRSRAADLGGSAARFVSFGEARGDGSFSIAEIQLFCRTPVPFPPRLNVVSAPLAGAAEPLGWNDTTSARFELALALAALLVVGKGAWLAAPAGGERRRTARDGLLALLGVLSVFAYVNFGAFHFPSFVHTWDMYHYFVGAKYFRELEYERLYECTAVADAEIGLRRRVELRTMTDLRNNAPMPAGEILAHPEDCKAHFSDARWNDFKNDLEFFRSHMSAKRWEDVQTDHGFNATPVWAIAGSLLANTGPASNIRITVLATLDCALMLAMAALIGWSFGWRILCVALIVYATNFPSRWYWTGGSLLRYDWIFWAVAGVCLVKKEREVLGGFAIGYAALLRIFPGFLLLGPLLACAQHLVKTRTLDRHHGRVLAGAALAVVLLVPLSMTLATGPEIYPRFLANTAKHASTPLTNHMGLRTVLSYRPSEVGRRLRSDRLADPWSEWKTARANAFHRSRWVFAALVLGVLLLLTRAVRDREPWVALALGATSIAFVAELTCYYYAFVIVVALLAYRRGGVAPVLLATTAATQMIAACGWWTDEQYVAMSVVTLAGLGAILAWFAVAPERVLGYPVQSPLLGRGAGRTCAGRQ